LLGATLEDVDKKLPFVGEMHRKQVPTIGEEKDIEPHELQENLSGGKYRNGGKKKKKLN